MYTKYLREFVARIDLVDKFREKYPTNVPIEATWVCFPASSTECQEIRLNFITILWVLLKSTQVLLISHVPNRCKSLNVSGALRKKKKIRTDKPPEIDDFPYEKYLRLLFLPLLSTVYNIWLKQESSIVKFLRNNKHCGDKVSNFHPLTMLNTDLKIFEKVLAEHLQAVPPTLIGHEQSCVIKSKSIQTSLLLVRTIIEKVDGNVALINFDQSKTFYRIEHGLG